MLSVKSSEPHDKPVCACCDYVVASLGFPEDHCSFFKAPNYVKGGWTSDTCTYRNGEGQCKNFKLNIAKKEQYLQFLKAVDAHKNGKQGT